MNKIRLSVVVPVYNVELYLDQCIESIINQTYNNLEIILVDDGSLDNCPILCDEWKKKDSRIKVIHKKNAGLGMARNTGIENATGDYICFIDSDDFIEKNTFEKCIEKLQKFKYDVIFYGHDKHDGFVSLKEYIPSPKKYEYFDNKSIVNELLPEMIIDVPYSHKTNMILSACMCLLKKSLIIDNDWRFVSERKIISEDIYSMFKLLRKANSICIINEVFYHYRINNSSLTRSFRIDRFDQIKKLHIELMKLVNDENLLVERFDYLFLSYSIACIKQIVSSNLKYSEKKGYIRLICNDQHLIEIINKYINKETKLRKLYFKNIRKKNYFIVYFFTYIQNKIKK